MAVIPDFEDNTLIDLIRSYPCLYCHLDKNYTKNAFKELSWTEIATQLDCPDVDLIKRRWTYLKRKFIKKRKKLMKANEDDDPDWPLYSVMKHHFDRFIRKRKSSSKKRKIKQIESSDSEDEEEEDVPEEIEDVNNIEMILCDDGPQLQPNESMSTSEFSDHLSESSLNLTSVAHSAEESSLNFASVAQSPADWDSIIPEFTDLDFINEIATYPCLYHQLSMNFRNTEKIEDCWARIAIKLNYPDINLLKKRWLHLKGKFTRMRSGCRVTHWPLYDRFNELFGRFILHRKRHKRAATLKTPKEAPPKSTPPNPPTPSIRPNPLHQPNPSASPPNPPTPSTTRPFRVLRPKPSGQLTSPPIQSSNDLRCQELAQKLNKLPSHEAESILNQMEKLIDEKSTKPRQYGRRITPVIMAEQIKQEVIVKVDPDDFE